jgi:hypothetical protein
MSFSWGGSLARVVGIDPRGLAALRIGLGTTLLADLLLRTDHFGALYTDAGAFPRRLLDPWLRETIFPFHLWSGSFGWPGLLWLLAVAAAVAMIAGWHTRLASATSWVLLVSLQVRNPLVLNFGDAILRMALFWAMFLPLGARWSLDASRNPSRTMTAERPVASVASAAYLLQICFVYFFTALLKSGSDWRETGLALYYALNLDYFATPLGVWIRHSIPLTILMTRSTLVLESIGPLALLAPIWWLRSAAVACFLALHLGIAASFDLGIFPWVDVVVLLPFLPPRIWDEFERRLLRVAPPAVSASVETRAKTVEPRRRLRRVGGAVLGGILLYLFANNVQAVSPAFPAPDLLTSAGRWLGINQSWQMFTPNGPRVDGWFVLSGRLANGQVVDLMAPDAPPSFEKPESVAARHSSSRWARFLFQLKEPETNGSIRSNWARWQCSDWNRQSAADRRLDHVEMWFVLERTPRPGVRAVPQRQHLLDFDCPAQQTPRAVAQ